MIYRRVNGVWLSFLASVLVLGTLVALLAWPGPAGGEGQGTPIFLYCAAGIRRPVEKIAREYEVQYGVPVQVRYQGSATILDEADRSKAGDLFLPADNSYLKDAHRRNMIDEVIPIAKMRPVLGVRKGNPKGIHSLEDLLASDARMSQADPDAAAIGKVAREILTRAGSGRRSGNTWR